MVEVEFRRATFLRETHHYLSMLLHCLMMMMMMMIRRKGLGGGSGGSRKPGDQSLGPAVGGTEGRGKRRSRAGTQELGRGGLPVGERDAVKREAVWYTRLLHQT